jgi:Nitrile hydratase beta subunit
VRSHHDMGGLPAGRVERSEHDYADWERRVDAMAVLLSQKRLLTVDQRRRAIETLTPEDYDALSYYERWVIALGQTLIQRGLITTAELATKMVEVEKRG